MSEENRAAIGEALFRMAKGEAEPLGRVEQLLFRGLYPERASETEREAGARAEAEQAAEAERREREAQTRKRTEMEAKRREREGKERQDRAFNEHLKATVGALSARLDEIIAASFAGVHSGKR